MLALVAMALVVLSNTVLRSSYRNTLRYDSPAVERQIEQTEPPTQPTTEPPTVAASATEAPTAEETEQVTEASEAEATEPAKDASEAEEMEPATEEATALESVQFPLDINTATLEQILFIPGVGNAMAQKIVQYRDYLGGAYSDLEQLRNISGVGDATYAKLWQHFTIEGEVYLVEEETDANLS